ncbi:hypothetical protein GOP47_0024273 [Adiantum capillus-veneris]|uniref:Plant synaptotagmin n=1 Tax=Adiantum capillus-veneris TaxID=13818 RepID=A0A9D4U5B5_ADICA|nr:hypothetical protein GOP47_0024273 [Adiantum capillus-veneris]
MWGEELANKPLLPLLLPFFLLAWLIRFLLPLLFTWLPLLLASFTALQYGRNKRNTVIEDLNYRWKRHILYTSPKTPLEPCEWVNKLLRSLWPGYMEQRLSQMLSVTMMKILKEKRPHPFRSIELQEFYLGVTAPSIGMQRTDRSSELDEQAFHMGFEWETNEMKVLLAAKLAGPFKGTACFVIHSLHIKGDLRIVPLLDGQAFVFSFTTCPEVRIGMAFGSGQSIPATELPPAIASWLEKLFVETLMRTMVEPQRRCFPLSAVSLRKRASGGVICITVISAKNLNHSGSFEGQQSIERTSSSGSVSGFGLEGCSYSPLASFVEVTVEGLTRSTHVSQHGGCPRWNDTFNMILHEGAGTVHFNVYEQGSSNVKCDFYGSCEVKVRYVEDGSTIFWASGLGDQVLAHRAENCGKEVLMEVPILGKGGALLSIRLLIKEWQFTDGSRTADDAMSVNILNTLHSLPSFEAHTGRTLRVTVMEGKNLAAKDRTGKSDPYVRLRYGKVERKTKIVKQDLNPLWRQSYEFPELGNGEHLQLKCFDADYLNDENLGSARINLEGLEDGVVRDVWIPLEKINTGEIRLLIEAYTSESQAETSQGETQEPSMDFQRGLLEVVILEARDLIAADLRGTSDPFVVLHYGDTKSTTKVLYKTLHPQWKESFEMSDSGKPLKLSVKDYNAVLPDVNIGRCVVEYEQLPNYEVEDRWIPLQGVRTGEIHVQVIRRPAKLCRSVTISSSIKTSDTIPKVLKKSHQVQALLKQAMVLTSTGNTDSVGKKLEEIEFVEAEKSICLSRLLRERDLLLAKIEDLGQALQVNEDGRQIMPCSTKELSKPRQSHK